MDARQILPPPGSGFIRRLEPRDEGGGLALSTDANWNQNADDWRLLTRICAGWGVDDGQRGLVGTAMAWPLGDSHAWVNMVLVESGCRGRGLARGLMETLLQELTEQRRVAFLDATAMGQGLYRKLGFRDGPELVRLAGEQVAPTAGAAASAGLRAMQTADLDAVAILDQEVFGFSRRDLLENLRERCPGAAWVLESVDGRLSGFIAARDGRCATQLGPLVAANRQDAGRLLQGARSVITGPVIMDVPAIDQTWLNELATWGFVAKRSFNRMTRGDMPLPTDWSRYFAISGPDFA